MRLAVCIPCYRSHVACLPDLIASIERQTVKPDVISISISSYTDAAPALETTIPIRIQITDEKRSAAENRNIAGAVVLDEVDILSFIDADDFMHSRRIEIIKYHMRSPRVHAVYHSYILCGMKPPADQPVTGRVEPVKWKVFPSVDPNLTARVVAMAGPIIFNKPLSLHAAHVSVRSDVFRVLQFPLNKYRADDSEYIYILHINRLNMILLRDSLTFFRHGATTLFTCGGDVSSQS